jgi:hypothetical protein
MNKLFKIASVIVCVVTFFGASRYVSAQSHRDGSGNAPAPAVHEQTPSPSLATRHVLEGTYINSGSLFETAIPANTFTPIDTQLTVACPGTTGSCTIEADMLVQNGFSTAASNNNRVCLYVDGNPGPNCDYYVDETTTDEFFINAVNADTVSGLATGDHTVQMYFWTADGADVSHYQATYHVYKP